MSILDQLLGNSDRTNVESNSNEFDGSVGTNPGLGLSLDDVLHSKSVDDDGDMSEFTGIGSLGLGLSAPTVIGISGSSDSASASEVDGNSGGLLGGLL